MKRGEFFADVMAAGFIPSAASPFSFLGLGKWDGLIDGSSIARTLNEAPALIDAPLEWRYQYFDHGYQVGVAVAIQHGEGWRNAVKGFCDLRPVTRHGENASPDLLSGLRDQLRPWLESKGVAYSFDGWMNG